MRPRAIKLRAVAVADVKQNADRHNNGHEQERRYEPRVISAVRIVLCRHGGHSRVLVATALATDGLCQKRDRGAV
jgi:hypothetical protein